MSTTVTSGSTAIDLPPSPSRTCCQAGEGDQTYHMCFYGGFVSQVQSVSDSGTKTLYDQKEAGNVPFVLPGGASKPWPSSVFEFSGGPGARRFTLQIEDPQREIERIEVVLKPTTKGSDRAVVAMQSDAETIVIRENPICCPPDCP
jgi:hypothetical protein